MVLRKINALKILMRRVDENDERTSWLIIHVVVWEIFELIGLYVGRFVFSSFAILDSYQIEHFLYLHQNNHVGTVL